jgi:hypothetical protein
VSSPAATTFILAICGSRSLQSAASVYPILDQAAALALSRAPDLSIRLGDAHGIDLLALRWARERAISRHICFADAEKFRQWQLAYCLCGRDETADLAADWERDGATLAGSKRNAAMLYGDPFASPHRPRANALLAIHDGISSGTETCIRQAELMEIEVWYELLTE